MAIEPGTRLGPYEVVAPIGRGAMGEVYRAIDTRLKREVALKLLPPQLTRDDAAKRRFLREAQTASALDHPNICAIHDIPETPDGQLCLVMAHYDGQTLDERIARGALPIDEAVDIALQTAAGLACAHTAGIVHRDIKPANLMVTNGGVVKILDFGIATLTGDDAITQTTSTLGTLAYMSPEHLDAQEVDHRSDLWSLGVVLHEMIAGSRPFSGEQPQAVSVGILTKEPATLTSAGGEVPPWLRAIVSRALAKDRDVRFTSANELAAALRDRSTRVVPAEAGTPTNEEPQKSIAVLPFANMSADPENEFFSDGISEEIINALGQIDGLRVAARTSAFSFKGKNVDLREVGVQLSVNSVLEGSVRKSGTRLRITAQLVNASDGYQLWSERYDRELDDVFAVQDEIARTIAERLKVTLEGEPDSAIVEPATDNLQAYELYLEGRELLYRKGVYIPQAVECFKKAVALDTEYALAWAGLADALTSLGYYGLVRPAAAFPQAKEAAARAVQLDDGLAEAHGALAGALLFGVDVDGSEQAFRRALEINAGFIQARGWYAVFVLALVRGRFDDALDHTNTMRRLDPLSAYVEALHASTLYFAGRHDEALEPALAAIDRDPQSFLAHWFLSVAYQAGGRLAEAVAAGHTALAVSGRHAWAMASMTTAYAELGRTADARALYDELVARMSDRYVPGSMLGLAAAALGLTDDAVGYVEGAVQERDASLPFTLKHFPVFEPLRQVLKDAGTYDEILTRLGIA